MAAMCSCAAATASIPSGSTCRPEQCSPKTQRAGTLELAFFLRGIYVCVNKPCHPLGDEALKRLARVISDGIRRPGDIAAHYGGEEFSVILPETRPGVAYPCRRIKKTARRRLLKTTKGESRYTAATGRM
ncbi:diguanylate cyclase [Pseudomonas gingeri]|nr:diguanylate cyclase [Pseudomonas gingeri]NWA13866.1 diguanylate cyclase [Pseudomonas gingeri]NWA52774.1 diguanylate cyclase [Pseudomonas gingeri]NWA96271.1 diguanylate cyclase [Pseudomonas gingeri]NWB00093.1 diguanylate cyclase [Pseudomonas gingeri]